MARINVIITLLTPLSGTGAVEYIVGGLLMGAGTYLANGCTSGHGLSGTPLLAFTAVVRSAVMIRCP